MENKKEYLSEEETQRISKKLGLISKVLLILGSVGFLVCSVLLFGNFLSFEQSGVIGFLWVGCFACIGFFLFYKTYAIVLR